MSTVSIRAAARVAAIALAGALAACASPPATAPAAAGASEVAAFSSNRPGLDPPRHWRRWIITRTKPPTEYRLVVDPLSQRVVVQARADRSASGLMQPLDVDPAARPVVQWEWRVPQLIEGADNTDRHAEDSPARLLLFFDGDKSTLPAAEQAKSEAARLVSGQELPYATLMYIWESDEPVDTVIDSALTTRLKMVVAASGAGGLDQWQRFERDYAADFRRAFGEAPGRLVGIGILTDTDNTRARAEAFYGDIRLRPSPGAGD